MTRRQLLGGGILAAAGSVGCRRQGSAIEGTARPAGHSRPIRVVVSSPIIGECVAELAGEAAEVTSLLLPGVPPSQLVRSGPTESLLVSAEAVVVLGLGWESSLEASVERARRDGVAVCVLEGSFPRDRLFPSADPARPDPHVWLDPDLWLLATQAIEEMLSRLRPAWAEAIAKRGRATRFRFEELGKDLRRMAAVVPAADRHLVTRNVALRYLGRAAGVVVEIGDPGAEYRANDPVESLALDVLQPAGEAMVLRGHSHKLSTVEGLVTHALDTMLLRVT